MIGDAGVDHCHRDTLTCRRVIFDDRCIHSVHARQVPIAFLHGRRRSRRGEEELIGLGPLHELVGGQVAGDPLSGFQIYRLGELHQNCVVGDTLSHRQIDHTHAVITGHRLRTRGHLHVLCEPHDHTSDHAICTCCWPRLHPLTRGTRTIRGRCEHSEGVLHPVAQTQDLTVLRRCEDLHHAVRVRAHHLYIEALRCSNACRFLRRLQHRSRHP